MKAYKIAKESTKSETSLTFHGIQKIKIVMDKLDNVKNFEVKDVSKGKIRYNKIDKVWTIGLLRLIIKSEKYK